MARKSLDSGRSEYEQRLQEIFKEIDITDKGYLDPEEVDALCSRLQLGRRKERVVQALQEREKDKEKVHFENFQQVFFALLEELEGQQSKSPSKSASKQPGSVEESPKAQPKLVIGRKKYGRRSLPDDRGLDMNQSATGQDSYNDFLQEIDKSGHSSPYVEIEGKNVIRRRQGPVPAPPSRLAQEETYEPPDQIVPIDFHEDATVLGLTRLKEICQQLGVAQNGYLTQTDLGAVCSALGMKSMKGEKIAELFSDIDVNRDGQVSLRTVMDRLNSIGDSHAYSGEFHHRSPVRTLSASARARSSSRGRTPGRGNTPSQFVSEDFAGLFSSLEWNEEGYCKSEEILDLWDTLGVNNADNILKSLGFNPNGIVKLTDLSSVLDDELANPGASEEIQHASRLTYQHEVRHLKSAVEQAQYKNKTLKSQLAESNALKKQLTREVDDRHAQMDKSWESKMLNILNEIKKAFRTVELKYQDQIKVLQTELDREREAGAAQASRLRSHLDDVQYKASQEEQRLSERLAGSQKEISILEKELQENVDSLNSYVRQNEQLKKELKAAIEQPPINEPTLIEIEERQALEEYKELLERKTIEHKELRDQYDELMEQLESTRIQMMQAARRDTTGLSRRSSHSRIPMLRGSSLVDMFSFSSVEASETDEDDGIPSAKMFKSSAMPKVNSRAPSISLEIEKSDLLEQQRKSLEESHRSEIVTLEAKYKEEQEKMIREFHEEKEWVLKEQKSKYDIELMEQLSNLKATMEKERTDLIQHHEAQKDDLRVRFEEERKALKNRLSNMEDTEFSHSEQIHNLQAELSELQEKFHSVKDHDLTAQLKHKEQVLIQEFDEERRNLAERFSRELEQHQSNYRSYVDQIFAKGAEGLSGKLRDDFLSLVRKHTEEEVGRSQAAILNQLHQDRSEISTLLEKEKSEIYKDTENQRIGLMEKYESQIIALNNEIGLLREKLEERKEALSEVVEKESTQQVDIGSEVVNNLRKEMEIINKRKPIDQKTSSNENKTEDEPEIHNKEELIVELAKMKETFELEKRELETQKNLLEEELTETQALLEAERKNMTELDALKETLKALKAEKREVEGMVEGMKEKLFLAYQQKGLEKADLESKFQDVRSSGFEEGQNVGREEGFAQGKEEGYEVGKAQGLKEGKDIGKQEGRKEAESSVEVTQGKQLQESKGFIESLQHDKNVLENRLKQEKERSNKCLMQAQDRDQLKARFDQLLGEKHAMESKQEETLNQILEDHQAEKEHLMDEIRKLEQRRIQAQSDKRAVEAHIGAVHQELEMAHQVMNEESREAEEESVIERSQNHSVLQEQVALLQYQLKEAEAAQQELGLLKDEYESLLQEKSDLEELVKRLRTKSFEDDQAKIKSQMDHIQTLMEEKNQMREILDQTSDQLIKSTTSMTLSQSKFVRELETLKQKTSSMMEKESYTQLQISLMDQQKLVITLQDAIREREALVDRVIREREEEIAELNQVTEFRVKDIQEKYNITQELLTKQKEKYKQLCNVSNKRNLLLKDLYVDYSNLKSTYADSDLHRRQAERTCRKLHDKCREYKTTLSRLCKMLSR